MLLRTIDDVANYSVDDIVIDEHWNVGEQKELRIHSIHAYPAKFPAFITTKALQYAKDQGINVHSIADVFCGCGTVAVEAKINNIDFWGCDINPVATLIAKVKSSDYSIEKVKEYYSSILNNVAVNNIEQSTFNTANERLRYWFEQEQYTDLLKYYQAINTIKDTKYKNLFKCIFSSSLKSSSKWLAKSIKPQIDPNKKTLPVCNIFRLQYQKFLKAYKENERSTAKITIENANFLRKRTIPKVDLIVTSPPYVTSYEYADLHQLSSLWLEYTDDYKKLRKGTIGSIHNSEDYYFETLDLNNAGRTIITQLRQAQGIQNTKIKAIARYYTDMQKTAIKCYTMLRNNGIALFVLGDTEYKGIKIENSRHLSEALLRSGFAEVRIVKRKISNKLLTPYRDKNGKFSKDKNSRTIYHEEFVILGRKNDA